MGEQTVGLFQKMRNNTIKVILILTKDTDVNISEKTFAILISNRITDGWVVLSPVILKILCIQLIIVCNHNQ